MKKASVLIGNSSMGVSEAPLLKLPVVNIGMRQKDRQNAGNMIFVPHNKPKIIQNLSHEHKKCSCNKMHHKSEHTYTLCNNNQVMIY